MAIRYTGNRANPPVHYGTIQKHALESVEDEYDDLFEIQLDEDGGILLMGCIELSAAMELYTKYEKNDTVGMMLAQGIITGEGMASGQGLVSGSGPAGKKEDPFLEEYLCTVVSDNSCSIITIIVSPWLRLFIIYSPPPCQHLTSSSHTFTCPINTPDHLLSSTV